MIRFFLLYGTAICLLFSYASYTGWDVINFNSVARSGPHGPNTYHK